MKVKEVLKIENLHLSFCGEKGSVLAVRGVDLSLKEGEVLALVGESGCGKTALCRAILGLHSQHAVVEEGHIWLCDRDITRMTEKEMETVRGKEAAMVFQEPMTSLNPTYSIGSQIVEAILVHRRMSKAEAKREAMELLGAVGIPQPEQRFYQYPHHFSGGMRQRVAIAIALAADPKVLIADEPTTSLDIAAQNQIVELLGNLCQSHSRSMVFITHDLGLAEQLAHRIAVMQQGKIVETGLTTEIFQNPSHPYTKKLLGYAAYGKGTSHYHGKLSQPAGSTTKTPQCDGRPLVRITDLHKGFFDKKSGRLERVLSGFSMNIYKGEIVGLVGDSGCGKSTLSRCLMGIYEPEQGEIAYEQGCRKQMIFQDSASAFNPRMTLEQIIAEPLVIAAWRGFHENLPLDMRGEVKGRRLDAGRLRQKVCQLMEQVELEASLAERHPYEVSGGQRQRAAIARALITDPDFLIADEPISALDVSIQAQIIHLLKKIHDERQLTMLLISHDIPMVEHISDRVVTVEGGVIRNHDFYSKMYTT
ncbi:MAG: ABC transporter ATP-binding protein [Firmicutes bacterium]|nr:ABC transporter ATP-binding protein [Bacillota bacterium]